jgi:hypothetical protein
LPIVEFLKAIMYELLFGAIDKKLNFPGEYHCVAAHTMLFF